MNLVSVRIVTDDLDRLVPFYEALTGVVADRPAPVFAELRTANGTLAIGDQRTVPAARPRTNGSTIVEFLVDDVDAVAARLDPDVDVVQEPTTMPWGNRSLLVRDPDGTLVNLFTPVSEQAVAKFDGVPR